jgi:hypothetical protein
VARARRSFLIVLAVGALTRAGIAAAQAPAGDSGLGAHVLRADARALRPGSFVFQTTIERDASTIIIGTRTVAVTQTSYGGSPAWLLLETRADDGIPAADSLFVDALSLRPIHWSSTLGRARVGAEFRGDTAFGAMSAPATRRSIVLGMPAGTMINAAMLETELRLLPLQAAWEDSTTTFVATLAATVLLPTRISVIGEDRVRVPAGQFDCWVVSVHAGDTARGLYWVTKQSPIVVRSALDVPAMGGAQLVSTLVRIAP